jgi:predicted alpha/beta hydrolase family esterase
MSLNKLSFRSIVVASTNDPWVSMQRAQLFAEKWGSGLISIGAAGHINALSAYGKWEQGLKILSSLS